MTQANNDDQRFTEAYVWIECGCWNAVVMTPIICWLQGPAVSTDQFVTRTVLLIVSICGALGMRIWNSRKSKKEIASAALMENPRSNENSGLRRN